MVAPAGDASRLAIPLSVGLVTAGQIAAMRGSTSPAYSKAGATLTYDECMIRRVHRQRGKTIINSQKGRTNQLLNWKIAFIPNLQCTWTELSRWSSP
jgi:hypothetical protein